jgi:hypothetical protein
LGNWDVGWLGRDAFVAEFCALGGTIVDQLGVDFFDPAGRDIDRVPATSTAWRCSPGSSSGRAVSSSDWRGEPRSRPVRSTPALL